MTNNKQGDYRVFFRSPSDDVLGKITDYADECAADDVEAVGKARETIRARFPHRDPAAWHADKVQRQA